MTLPMPRPSTRHGSTFHQFRKRVPADIQRLGRGVLVQFIFPAMGVDPEVAASARIGREITLSLRTRNPSTAKARNGIAAAQVETLFASLRAGPKPLSHKQRVALAGLLYHAFADGLAEDPSDPELWARVKATNKDALYGPLPGLMIGATPAEIAQKERAAAIERRFGGLVDLILQREGIVTDAESRNALLREAARALNEAAAKLERNANGDYRPDPQGERFPAFERPAPTPPAAVEPDRDPDWSKIIAAWERAHEARGGAASTRPQWRTVVENFAAFAKVPPAQVTAAHVRAWRDHRLASGASVNTVQGGDLAALRTVFGVAVEEQLLSANPAREVRVRGARKNGQRRRRGFSNEQPPQSLPRPKGKFSHIGVGFPG